MGFFELDTDLVVGQIQGRRQGNSSAS